ncbi:substrate-binding periplasmic protein [Thioalkalivibrio paradoxus]|uniref:ABC transporter substrate-binding protein n=1 Tax=Thioalkalivibrio paradoxus ARh 1 TaxID=713585 RepID=W0DIY7_9GAMM|nr:transporter substrate-binding domain-containing protein [Thioalkalivibrio paradoxus]AHE98574.1 ABC transporter substrate-binding protein [Thioalkalivibrio paradoxus ARh 1]
MRRIRDCNRQMVGATLGLLLLMLAGGLFPQSAAKALDEIQWITEEFAPYNYTGADGVPTGIAVDVLVAMWDRLGHERAPGDIEVLPWARGYRIAQDHPGTCLFSTTITDARRELFTFIEPLVAARNAIIGPVEREFEIRSIDDLAPYSVGVVRDDIGDQLLQQAGANSTVVRTDSWRILLRMLQGQRFDLISYNIDTARWNMRRLDMDPYAYEPLLVLQQGVMGYACHPDTNPTALARLQTALDALLADGTVERITRSYLGPR